MKKERPVRFTKYGVAIPALAVMLSLTIASASAAPSVRIKDIARIAGMESIELIGYGVVIGLNGTGDNDIELTQQTMANLLEHFDISLDAGEVKSKNVAVVIATASAPPFHRAEDKVDVRVSSIGDAKSLEGGVLLMTPLLDPNGELYAIAQGSITVGGFSVGRDGGGGETVTKNHTTTAIVAAGATMKSEQDIDILKDGTLRILLRHPDFTTAERVAGAINEALSGVAVADNASTITVQVPSNEMDTGRSTAFISELEMLKVVPDIVARVIVNERTGTIVMGGDVQISEALVAHGNLTVAVKETLHASHPENLILKGNMGGSGIRSLETPDIETTVTEEDAPVIVMPTTATVREMADALNMLGATPRDLISILQALRRLGAIQMELQTM